MLTALNRIKVCFDAIGQYQIFYEEDRRTAELAKRLTAYGRAVVSDNVFRSKDELSRPDLSHYEPGSYFVVLVYATLANTVKNIEKRNARLACSGDLRKHVDVEEGVRSYRSFFRSSQRPSPRFFHPNFVLNSHDTKEVVEDTLKQIKMAATMG